MEALPLPLQWLRWLLPSTAGDTGLAAVEPAGRALADGCRTLGVLLALLGASGGCAVEGCAAEANRTPGLKPVPLAAQQFRRCQTRPPLAYTEGIPYGLWYRAPEAPGLQPLPGRRRAFAAAGGVVRPWAQPLQGNAAPPLSLQRQRRIAHHHSRPQAQHLGLQPVDLGLLLRMMRLQRSCAAP